MSSYLLTFKDAYDGLSKQFLGMKKSSQQAVAHRKKFQLVISQFSQFLESFQKGATDEEMEPEQIEAYQNIISISREYFPIFRLHYLHCWAHSAIDDSCMQVATELCSITMRLFEEAKILYPEGSTYFDANDPKWLQFHVMDLKAISESFKQYCNTPGINKKIANMMENKQNSINKFIAETEAEQIIPGIRFFSPIPINYQIWRVEHSDFTEENEIGSGSFAVVFYGHYEPTGQEIAVKRLNSSKLSSTNLTLFQREVIVLATVKYPTLLGFIGATDTPPYCILTEWMGGGSLFQDIHKNHRLDATKLSIAAFDVARGMAYLHAKGIIHRDLKSLNILLDTNGFAKVCDFGLSRFASADNMVYTQNIGTPHWMAPEILGGASNYNEKVDVYAYAIVLWEMLCKKIPYAGLEPQQVIGQVLLNNIRPAIPKNTPEGIQQLIKMCWDRDPDKRPSFSDILKIWKTGNVYFPASNEKAINEYIEKSMDDTEKATNDVESYLSSSSSSEIEIFYQTLQKDGIPEELTERCWSNLQSINHSKHEETYIKCLGMFLNTSNVNEAARALRNMKRGSLKDISITKIIPAAASAISNCNKNRVDSTNSSNSNGGNNSNNRANFISNKSDFNSNNGNRIVINPQNNNNSKNKSNSNCNSNSSSQNSALDSKDEDLTVETRIIDEIIDMLPTGNSQLDDDLFMIACKNGAIEDAFLRTVSNKHIIISLEIFSRGGWNESNAAELNNAVIERALKCLQYNDASMRISVIRFFVSLNESEKIPIEFIKNNIDTRNLTLRNALLVAASQMAANGVRLPNDLIEMCLTRLDETMLTGTLVVNACRNPYAAEFVLNRMANSIIPSIKLMVEILIQISFHDRLKPKIKVLMKKLYLPKCNDDIAKAIEKINGIIQ